MKKRYLLMLLTLSFTLVQAADEQRKALSAIQEEINQLQNEIHRVRLKSIAEELQGNQYMGTQWGQYVDQIEKSEHSDVQLMKLEKQLKELQDKKSELLIQYKLDQRASDEE